MVNEFKEGAFCTGSFACIFTILLSIIKIAEESEYFQVLLVEQYLTTGGGWQDQVGGATGGIKIARFSRQAKQVLLEQLDCDQCFVHEMESKLLLIYTGRTRLAKNLLQVCSLLSARFI